MKEKKPKNIFVGIFVISTIAMLMLNTWIYGNNTGYVKGLMSGLDICSKNIDRVIK